MTEISIGFVLEVGAGGDLGDAEVWLGAVLAAEAGLASSPLNIAATISPIGRGHPTSVSSVA